MNDNWWYAIYSKSIMDNKNDKLTSVNFEIVKTHFFNIF